MAGAFVQHVGNFANSATSATTAAVTVPAGGIPAGHTLIVHAACSDATPGAFSCADSRGNTYTEDENTDGTNRQMATLSCRVTTALQAGDTITVTFPASLNRRAIRVDEFSGIFAPKDTSGEANSTSSGTTPSASATPSASGALVVGAVTIQGPTTDGYTEDADSTGSDTWHSLTESGTNSGTPASDTAINAAYKFPTSAVAQTYNPILGTSRQWVDQVVVYLAIPAPDAVTGAATDVEQTTATLNATVDPNGDETEYYFEYGLTAGYGSTTTPGSAGAGGSPAAVDDGISGLAADTTYHFRVVATNDGGTDQGSDQTFTTSVTAPRRIKVAEPEWTAVELETLDGSGIRFGHDEADAGSIPYQVGFDTQNPGGFDVGAVVLKRPPKLRADDAALWSAGRFYGPGNRTKYEGRISAVPQVGVNEVRLDFEGWVNHLEDDNTFRALFRDIDFGRWQGAGVQRQIDANPAFTQMTNPSVNWDESEPSLLQELVEPWGAAPNIPLAEAWYDAQGLDIAYLEYAYKHLNLGTGGTTWTWTALLSDDARLTNNNTTGDLESASPGPASAPGRLTASGVAKKFACLQLYYYAAAGTDGVQHKLFWKTLAVVGKHGLTEIGSGSAPADKGFRGSDIIAFALDKSCPLLNYTLGESIETSTVPIPHLTFFEQTNVRNVVEQVTLLGGAAYVPNDWGVYERRQFYHRSPGSYGRTWRVRRDQVATPTSEGPDAKRRMNGIQIVWQDASGRSLSIGPPGSGSTLETDELLDTDQSNPATRLQRKWPTRNIGISDSVRAKNIGIMLLNEQSTLDWRGSVELVGEVQDDKGVKHSTAYVRAGDRVVVEDDEYPTPRPIIKTTCSQEGTSKVKADIGATPYSSDTLLANVAAINDRLG